MARDVEPSTGLRLAEVWLAKHGLDDVRPTPLLATRLVVRERARLGAAVILAVLIIASGLAALPAFDGDRTLGPLRLLALVALVVGLLLAQSLLDRWVRRVDRRAGAALSRRVTHPVHPGWRTVLGWPYAVFAAATCVGAMVLVASALAVPDPAVRQVAAGLLIGLLGLTAVNAMHLRHLLRRPVVAEDEGSLTADVIMRIEDARDLTRPIVQLALPMTFLFGVAPGWWSATAVAFLILSMIACVALPFRTPSSATVARRAMSGR
ncbi:hypothetical protein E1200_13705 [Actinomadura sp. GC306]|uniref:hypothetical protein n=1 Tax=Actinomadura sp. GC306 TaxID=2530367 RepID=UPI00104C420A|nr:hypothetical protein [Actinomadura sp. GC306]TDC67842.1 hypothetical protein E1200_13705 [Actinomadura sp. GC306]